jgi:A/G-specific adenine glycosylase
MLQQTQVQTVKPYFERWLREFPTLAALAASDPDRVLALWQGLGYYSRARSLHRGAQQVVRDGGALPRDVAALQKLPGIGPYTAGAIASIAFGLDEPVVDGNVIRVLTRLFALHGDPAKNPLKGQLWGLARALIPKGDAADFNQALMELGATRCTPRSPVCGQCPVSSRCAAFTLGTPSAFPELRQRPAVSQVRTVACWLRRGEKILLGQLPADAPRWAGLWVLPTESTQEDETPGQAAARILREQCGLHASKSTLSAQLKHSITRFAITLEVFDCEATGRVRRGSAYQALRWVSLDDLENWAMPAPHRKLVRALGGRSEQ